MPKTRFASHVGSVLSLTVAQSYSPLRQYLGDWLEWR